MSDILKPLAEAGDWNAVLALLDNEEREVNRRQQPTVSWVDDDEDAEQYELDVLDESQRDEYLAARLGYRLANAELEATTC